MHAVALTWQESFEVAAVVGGAGIALAVHTNSKVRNVGAFLREAAIIGVLHGIWKAAQQISLTAGGDAYARARWIERFESRLELPSEKAMQQPLLDHPLLMHVANLYYACMHFPSMFAFLIWLFVRHRDRYRPVRQVMAWTTLACLVVQLIPVAPPRVLPGYVDTGLRDNLSVYNTFDVNQLGAMPSVHVAWAAFVGWYFYRINPTRWRWLGPVHAVLTGYFVAATANHWWLDGIVAVALLVACAWAVAGTRTVWQRLRGRGGAAEARELAAFAPPGPVTGQHVA